MKKPILFLLLAVLSLPSFCQVRFESLSFEQALQRAKESGRLIFLQFDSPTCDQCNEVATKGLEDTKLASQLEQGFVCVRIGADHPDRNKIANLYNVDKFFGSVFLGSDGALLHTFPRTTTRSAEYLNQIDIALTKAGEGLRINEFEKEYKNGNRNIALLEQLLLLRKTLFLHTDTLLDEYVSLLPADSLRSPTTIVFIARQFPVIGSKADILFRKDYTLFNKAWYTLPLSERVAINNVIILKSRQKAVREKNVSYAYRVASFARGTNNTDNWAGMRAYDSNILEFYKETNDTLNYLARAMNFFDGYYMIIDADSVRKTDSINRDRLFTRTTTQKTPGSNGTLTKKTFSFTGMAQGYAGSLNNGAWSFYKWTSDPVYLQKALQWSYRAIELFESPEALDTYARLLYKTGKKNEALQWESRAIELRKKRGFDTADFEKVLANIKAGKAVIDN
jgi:hypothetical protein